MSLASQISALATRLATEFNSIRSELGSASPTYQTPRKVKAASTATVTLSGSRVVDGITVSNPDRVLIKDQASAIDNGVYVVQAGAWTRATDFDTAAEVAGAQVAVQSGTVNGGTQWATSFKSTDTVGTTAMNWTAAGGGVSANIVDAAGDLIVGTGDNTVARKALGTYGQTIVADPTASGAATILWTHPDARITGVKAATTGNITLSGSQTIDGVTLVNGIDLVLVKNQSTASQNGVYLYNSGGAWTRAAQLATGAWLAGSIVRVQAGTTNGGTQWATSWKSTDTIDTTAMTWTQLGSGGSGIPASAFTSQGTLLAGTGVGTYAAKVTSFDGWVLGGRASTTDGFDWLPGVSDYPALCATTQNITLSGFQTIDGISVNGAFVVLVKNQTTTSQNGVYTASSGAWTRHFMFLGNTDLAGVQIRVQSGAVNGGTSWTTNIKSGQVVGTAAMNWSLVMDSTNRAVKVATTGNITLSGGQTIDGITVVTGDRVLVNNQTTASQNGIYVASTGGAWSRSADASTAAIIAGAAVRVQDGTQGGSEWTTTFKSSDALDTDPMYWYQAGASYGNFSTPNSPLSLDQGRALRTFRGSYLGGVTNNPTDILIVGGSFEEGYGTTLMTNGWTNVFRDVLRGFAQPKGLAGGGSVPASNASYQAGVGNYFGYSPKGRYTGGADGTYPDSPIIAASGTFNTYAGQGLGLRTLAVANGASYTLEFFGTGADLLYSTNPVYGNWTWAVDGGGATTVIPTAAASFGNRVQIRNLARGRHTIVVTQTTAGSGGAGAIHEGAAFYDGDETSGIRVWQAAHSGYKATDFATTTTWASSIQTWNMPDLVIINLGFNDVMTNVSPRTAAQVKTDLESIITLVKNRVSTLGGPTPSFVLMSTFNVVTAGSTPVDTLENLFKVYYQIAQADADVCVFDYQRWFGLPSETSQSTRGGILVADGLHPTDSGSAIIGGALANFVLDSSERMRDLVRYGAKSADPVNNASLVTQGPGFATDTYLTGSNVAIPAGRIKPGTIYRLKMYMSKTGAGLATPIVQIRMGTAGTIADTSRCTITFAAQTAVIDEGFIEIYATFRSYGSGTATIIQGSGLLNHRLAATGLSTSNASSITATGAGFDGTTANTYIGCSLNAGTSAAWTVTMVQAEIQGLA